MPQLSFKGTYELFIFFRHYYTKFYTNIEDWNDFRKYFPKNLIKNSKFIPNTLFERFVSKDMPSDTGCENDEQGLDSYILTDCYGTINECNPNHGDRKDFGT